MRMLLKLWPSALAALALTCFPGCSSPVICGGARHLDAAQMRLFVPPFANATDNEQAGRALTELTASALLAKGLPLVQTEPSLAKSRAENAAGPEGLYRDAARAAHATHLLIGTVHEYRYKNDLNGDPVVGVTMRLVDAEQGRTLWQGSASREGVWFGSLTRTASCAVRSLVDRMPLNRASWTPP